MITIPQGTKLTGSSRGRLESPPASHGIDGLGFMQRVESYLNPFAPIMTFVIKKQMSDLSASADSLTPDLARRFIDRILTVLRTFVPEAKVEEMREALLREFRRAAPRYAEQLMYGGR